MTQSTFPLPLVSFERYMLADDRPGYPMTGVLTMEFEGEFERPAFEAALDEALVRHPLFWARIEGMPPVWMPAPSAPPPLDWGPLDAAVVCPADEAIDLRREVGFRLWLRQSGGRAVLVFLLHHSAADAIGALQFLGDVLAGYAIRTAAGAPELAPLEPERLRRRGIFAPPAQPVSRWRAATFLAQETYRWLAERPAPLAAPTERAGSPPAAHVFPGVYSHTLCPAETAALKEAAGRRGGTINDLLLGELFATMAAWNHRHRPGDTPRWLRVTMPTNLREEADARMPSANKMSYAFITRRAAQIADPDELLRGICAETTAIKNGRLGIAFLSGMGIAQQVPGAMRHILAEHRCLSTAVLSNVGAPNWHFFAGGKGDGGPRFGSVRLTRLTASPPLRPNTRACFVVSRSDGCLTLSVRGDRHVFSPADVRELLQLYVGNLARSAVDSSVRG